MNSFISVVRIFILSVCCLLTGQVVFSQCQTEQSITNVSICYTQAPYIWNGQNLMQTGVYYAYLKNNQDCDSLARLNLTVNPTAVSYTTISICTSSLPYIWNGNAYNSTGVYSVKLFTTKGCDSMATLQLKVNTTSSSTTAISICSSVLPYTWNGIVCTKAGTYQTHLINSAGCDSSVTLVLSVKNTVASATNVSICSSYLPYYWNGVSYSVSGSYVKKLVNYFGCDSIATLNLTVKKSDTSTTNISVCSFPYFWVGGTCFSPGTYYQILINSAGCDSTVTLNLTRLPNNWTGSISSAWEDPANWSCGILPDENSDVVIDSGTVVLSTNTSVWSLHLNSNASFTIAEGNKLTILH